MRAVFFALLFSIVLLSGCPQNGGGNVGANGKNVLMVVAPSDFRDEELFDTRHVLEQAGVNVTLASTTTNVITGMLGGEAMPDVLLSGANSANYDAIVFIGGGGASIYFDDPVAQNLAKNAVSEGKVVGAICVAPSILANAGLLEGKNATAFSSEQGNLEAKGANYTGEAVTIDGKLITANGPEAANGFGEAIVGALG